MSEEKLFMSRILAVYKKCSGLETYGDTTEVYDEDGLVIMTTTKEEDGIIFNFGGMEDTFKMQDVIAV